MSRWSHYFILAVVLGIIGLTAPAWGLPGMWGWGITGLMIPGIGWCMDKMRWAK